MDNIDFESYGAHLRNLFGPTFNWVQVIIDYKNGQFDEETFMTLINCADEKLLEENLKDLTEFSKIPLMEKMNWRQTKLYKKKNK